MTRREDLLSTLKIGSYFALWYIFNVAYNIVNKKVLNAIPAPLTVGCIQFGVGAVYTVSLWMTRIRTSPTLTQEGSNVCVRLGIYHCIGMLLSMVSIGSGTVSFTHIVKACEPFFSAVILVALYDVWMKPQVYATLIPVVGGVCYACMNERSFSWLAFSTAMGSNVAFALRAVVSKAAMGRDNSHIGRHISSVTLFGIITCVAFFISIPIALVGEGTTFLHIWKGSMLEAELNPSDQMNLLIALIISGLFHYWNNEVMYLALSNVHPVTLAVGNTLKRVVIMIFSFLIFQNPITFQAVVGSAIGVSGALLYSLANQYYEKKPKKN